MPRDLVCIQGYNTNTAPNSVWHRTLKSVFRQTRDAAQLVDCLLACMKPWTGAPMPEKPQYVPITLALQKVEAGGSGIEGHS